MALELIYYAEDGVALVDADLVALRAHGKAGKKDEAKLRAALDAWADHGFSLPMLDFKPIEGVPYNKKMWEARYLKTARSDGVHGYRVFYVLHRNLVRKAEAVVLLRLWAKSGASTPKAILDEAWALAQKVEKLIALDKFEFGT